MCNKVEMSLKFSLEMDHLIWGEITFKCMKEIFLLKAWNVHHFKRILFMNLNLNITSNNYSLSEILMKGIFIEKEKYNIFFLKKGEGHFLQNGIIF